MANVVKGTDNLHSINYNDKKEIVSVTINNNGDYLTFGLGDSSGSTGGFITTTKTITKNSTYNASTDGANGYDTIYVNIPEKKLQSKSATIRANGNNIITPNPGYTGLSDITVNVALSLSALNVIPALDSPYFYKEAHQGNTYLKADFGQPARTIIIDMSYPTSDGISMTSTFSSSTFSKMIYSRDKYLIIAYNNTGIIGSYKYGY